MGGLTPGETRAVIVSESLARRQWPGADALGKPLGLGVDASGAVAEHTVVGVAGSARTLALKDSDTVEVYQLGTDQELPSMSLLAASWARRKGWRTPRAPSRKRSPRASRPTSS